MIESLSDAIFFELLKYKNSEQDTKLQIDIALRKELIFTANEQASNSLSDHPI